MPRYVAERVLLAPLDDVWAFVAEPYHLSDWWPGVSGVEPDRRGLAPGARWKVLGPGTPGYFRRPASPAMVVVEDVVPYERFSFLLPRDRLGVELELRATDAGRTRIAIAVSGRFLVGPRSRLAAQALTRLYDLVQTAAER